MKTIKAIGRLVVYIIFLSATWLLNFLICVIAGSLFFDESDGLAGNIYTICVLFLPIITSTLETIAFKKKWEEKRASRIAATQVSNHHVSQEASPLEHPTGHVMPAVTQPHSVPVTLVDSNKPANTTSTDTPSTMKVAVTVKRKYTEPPQIDTSKSNPHNPIEQDAYLKYGGVDAELLNIDLMEGHKFEHWCATALSNMGFSNIEVTPPSGDHGVDILAAKGGIKYAIQCKRYNSDLSNKPVQEVHAGKDFYHCHVGVVMTNQHFTSGAKQLAEATGTLLWDREWIRGYIMQRYVSVADAKKAVQQIEKEISKTSAPVHDELLPSAVDVILETGQASVSMLQRRLKLGYARCARIMDEIEEIGIVGPFQGSAPREILITKRQWESMRSEYAH